MENQELTARYLSRKVDARMLIVIEKHFGHYETLLDLGCGNGLYGKFLRKKADKIIGFDHDQELCSNAQKGGDYDQVICAEAADLNKKVLLVQATFCSEFLEHMPNTDLEDILSGIEKITADKIVFTVPNPLSPHFHQDPSHILRYSIFSLLKKLNFSRKFSYKLYPLGFSEAFLKNGPIKLLNILSSRIALFSPTVAYVGQRKPLVR